MTNAQTSPERILFLDNIRYLMVIIVIIFHAALAYCTIVPWWSVVDSRTNKLFDIFVLTLNNFQLPVLFFISGYFVLPGLRKQSTTNFIVSKLKRFGIPLVILGLFYTPVIRYIYHVVRTPEPVSYYSHWLTQIKSLSDLSFVTLSDAATGTAYASHISQCHLWFISFLLVLFLMTAAVYHLKQKLYPHSPHTLIEPQSKRKILMMVCIFGVLMSCFVPIINLNFIDWAWVRLGGFLLFQPTRIPVYSGVFIMGIYAYHRGWFHAPLPGHYMLWFTLAGILSFAIIACIVIMGADPTTIQPLPAVATGVIRIFLVLSWIFAFMNLGATRWNSQGSVGKQLTRCSYELYLIHLPIVVLLQYAMMPVNASAFVKFGIVAVMSVGITAVLARLFVTTFPRWSTAGLLTGFVLATLFIG